MYEDKKVCIDSGHVQCRERHVQAAIKALPLSLYYIL